MKLPATRSALLAWYDREGRDLPWRRTREPYAIWVSEIMCQQTRVETAVPYFERFMARFPDPESLASASEDEVLSLWSGLGYYRRARMLHRGVREVVQRYGGEVPEDPVARLGLPGVGRYTAGAIGSIAFDRPEPVVDGNVSRVLARYHGVETPIGRSDTERVLWALAAEWVEGPRPGDLNQAVMELGARVCTPKRAPECGGCPIRPGCVAADTDRQAELPVPRVRRAPRTTPVVAVVATRGERAAFVQRGGGLFGGLWGLPTIEGEGRAAARLALKEHGVAARLAPEPLGELVHVLSHRRLEVSVFRATGARLIGAGANESDRTEAARTEAARLMSRTELAEVGSSTLTERVLSLAGR